MSGWVDWLARECAKVIGHPITIATFLVAQVIWIAVGFFAGFAEAWHLWMMTPLTVLTAFALMPLQYSQNRDTAEIKAMLREMVEDIDEVDEAQAKARVKDEM